MKKYTELKTNQTLQETNQSVFKDVCQEGTGIVGVKKIKNDYNWQTQLKNLGQIFQDEPQLWSWGCL